MGEEPSYEDVVHALRVRLVGNPELRNLSAEDISTMLMNNGDLPTKPDLTLVGRALKELERE